jgi:DNA mismatch repair protein MutS
MRAIFSSSARASSRSRSSARISARCCRAGTGFPPVAESCSREGTLCHSIFSGLHELPHLVSLLASAIVEEPPALTRDGGMFRDGYYAPLDELRNAARAGKDWIAELQQREADATGIKSLKVRYTSVFGYFMEVTKSNLHLVPPTWHRKQTVATGSASSRRS